MMIARLAEFRPQKPSPRNDAFRISADPEIQKAIRTRAQHLIGREGLKDLELCDLQQALTLSLVVAEDMYDPAVGNPRAYANGVLNHATARLLRHARADCRYRPPSSAKNKLQVKDDELFDAVEEFRLRHRSSYDRPRQEIAELALDVIGVLEALPPRLREIAELLQFYSLSEVARRLKRARSSVQEDRQKIRKRFEHHGLQRYV